MVRSSTATLVMIRAYISLIGSLQYRHSNRTNSWGDINPFCTCEDEWWNGLIPCRLELCQLSLVECVFLPCVQVIFTGLYLPFACMAETEHTWTMLSRSSSVFRFLHHSLWFTELWPSSQAVYSALETEWPVVLKTYNAQQDAVIRPSFSLKW